MQKVPYDIWAQYVAFLKAKVKDVSQHDIWAQYVAFLKAKVKDVSQHENLKKWFLYFWDFRAKYRPPDSRSEQVRLFIEKLRNKGQSQVQQKQAAHAVSLYFQMHDAETKAATISTASHYPEAGEGSPLQVSEAATTPSAPRNHNSPYPPLILRGGGEAGGVTIEGEYSNLSRAEAITPIYSPIPDMQQPHAITEKGLAVPRQSSGSHYSEWRCLEKSGSPAWDKVIDNLAAEIKTRHYSRKTLKTYADWSRKFQSYLRNKLPLALYEAVRRAKLTKRVTTHIFRHSFATHLLQANYDIRTIQTLFGHSDVRTTMIYTHCVPSKTIKDMKSPLDF